jgi:mRNA-degrading endonuclease toxin of MazEF toxin-antitoxin module
MTQIPQVGEAWFVDFGYEEKPRYALVVASSRDGRLALASVVKVTTHYGSTPFEVILPRVPWLREQSYINAQSIQPVRFIEFVRKAPGQFQSSVMTEVRKALDRWLAA